MFFKMRTSGKQTILKVNQFLRKAVAGRNLTAQETEKVLTNISLNDKDGYHYLAFCVALHTKGETSEELLGICQTTAKLGKKLPLNVSASRITDLAGTGGGRIKTINVSTTASFIVSGANYIVAKQAFPGITSPTGSADVFKMIGINVFNLTINQISKTLEKVGICPIFVPAMSPRFKNRSLISHKVLIEKGVQITTPFHLVSSASSPVPLKRRIYGCYSEKYLEVLGELFAKLGNERTLVLHGVDGLAEASNVGKTVVVDQIGEKIKRYTLTPQDFGLRRAKIDEIKTGGRKRNIIDFLRILYGKEKWAKRDIVLANAAASLYVMGKVKSFPDGTKLAGQIIDEGLAFKKLEELVKALGDERKLDNWKKQAGLASN